jgi:hypothetical protein
MKDDPQNFERTDYIRLDHWTECYLEIVDLTCCFYVGNIRDRKNGARRESGMFPRRLAWKRWTPGPTAYEVISSIKVKRNT